jgi:surfeit locus 1 family protein
VKRWLGLAIGLLVAGGCVRLGFWQLDRLRQRRASNVTIERRLSEPPLEVGLILEAPSAAFDTLQYRRAMVGGTFDFERQVVVMARSLNGVPAVIVVTPLLVDSTAAILVERGIVPSPDARSVDLNALVEAESSIVTGVLLAPRHAMAPASAEWPVHVRDPDPAALAPRYPYRLSPMVLRRDSASPGRPSALQALALPERTNGPHLSYAIQWFAFAGIAVVGSVVLFRRTSG